MEARSYRRQCRRSFCLFSLSNPYQILHVCRLNINLGFEITLNIIPRHLPWKKQLYFHLAILFPPQADIILPGVTQAYPNDVTIFGGDSKSRSQGPSQPGPSGNEDELAENEATFYKGIEQYPSKQCNHYTIKQQELNTVNYSFSL